LGLRGPGWIDVRDDGFGARPGRSNQAPEVFLFPGKGSLVVPLAPFPRLERGAVVDASAGAGMTLVQGCVEQLVVQYEADNPGGDMGAIENRVDANQVIGLGVGAEA
jgi:hypothetical protein